MHAPDRPDRQARGPARPTTRTHTRARLCALALLAAHGGTAAQQSGTGERAAAPAALLPASLREHVEALTAPAMQGRGTGQAGFALAAQYVAERMRALGLEPLGDQSTHRQAVPWTRVDAVPTATRLRATAGDAEVVLAPGTEFGGRVWFDQEARGDVALLTGEDPTRLLPARGTVTGRVLFVELRGTSLDERFAGQAGATAWGEWTARLREAKPAAVVFVDDVRTARLAGFEGTDSPGHTSPAARAASQRPNELYVPRAARDRIAALASSAGGSHDAAGLRLVPISVEVAVDVESAVAPACNVVGRLRGSDPALAEEHVVVGCHLDHLGVENGVVHPGADDNASGTAALLGIAEALAGARPRRSVVFAAFCGEERGLLGSKHFVQHTPVPLPSIVAELQLDMVGRSEENARETAAQNVNSLHLIGTEKLSGDLHALCLGLNRSVGRFDLEWDEEEVFWRSDHVNFAKKGIPVAFFFTGFHADYHGPGDTADKLDYDKLARVAVYVHAVAERLANDDARPLVDRQRWDKARDRLVGPSQPAAPVRR